MNILKSFKYSYIIINIYLVSILSLLTIPHTQAAAPWSSPYEIPYGPNIPTPYHRSPYHRPPYQIPQTDYNFRPQDPNKQDPAHQNRYIYQHSYTPAPPKLEAEISNDHPYVQENVILTLRVISTGNIQQMDPSLPQHQSIIFQLLHNPISFTRLVDDQTEIVNEMRYMVTAINTGPIAIKPSVTVVTNTTNRTNTGQYTTRTTLELSEALHLKIHPPKKGVTPWLPLEQLALDANLDAPPTVKAGEPVTLMLKLSAAGALGKQLPSLEKFLQVPDFHVYKGKTKVAGGPSQDRQHIMGIRTEYYTLVPQYGGILRLPELRIAWFNVNTNTIEYTTLPIKLLTASGSETGRSDRFLTDKSSQRGFWTLLTSGFWPPVIGILLLLIGYWLGVWYHNIWRHLIPLGTFSKVPYPTVTDHVYSINTWFGNAIKPLNPMLYWQYILNTSANYLPLSIRFWSWIRAANVESTPIIWHRTLQFLSNRALASSTSVTVWPSNMAERIIQLQPAVDPERIKLLLEQLDAAIYGNTALDFERWKQDFEQEVRPKFKNLFIFQKTNRKHHEQLPPLNPEIL